MEKSTNQIWTVPNALSLIRLGTTIPLICCLHQGRVWWAFSWAAIGIVSDSLDGFLARKLNQCSDLGRILDPVIDKVVTISVITFLVLSPRYHFPLWFCLFLILREGAVLVFGLTIVRKKQIVMESTRPGKLSAFLTGAMVLFFMMQWQPVAMWLLYAAFVLTVYSSVVYLKRFQDAVQNVKA